MSEDPINEDDEIEESVEDGDADDADEELLSPDDAPYAATSKAAAVEALEDFSIAARQKIRDELEDQVAAEKTDTRLRRPSHLEINLTCANAGQVFFRSSINKRDSISTIGSRLLFNAIRSVPLAIAGFLHACVSKMPPSFGCAGFVTRRQICREMLRKDITRE